jgi:hypothetical protein
VLLTVPLHSLQITYSISRTSDAWPLSNAYKNCITKFQNMYDHCSCQTASSNHNLFDLTSSHFDSYCMLITHNHDWLPPVLSFCHCTHAPAYHHLPLVSPEHSNDGEESGALIGPEHFSQDHTTFMMKWLMHPPVPVWIIFMIMYWRQCASIVMDTEELFEEQHSKIMLFSPIEDSLQVWKHHSINLMVSIAGS